MSTYARPEMTMGSILDTSSTQKYRLGMVREYYENKYVYCKAGAVALAGGTICVTPAITAAQEVEDTVTVAHAAGTKDVTVTADATWTANQFKDGYLWVDSGTGVGECYRIESHPAIDTTTGTVTLTEPLVTAWVIANTDIAMSVSPYRGVLVAPTDAQSHAVCVPQGAVAANYYFWGLAKGYGAILIDVNGGTVGLELDEAEVTMSPNHAGQGLLQTPGEAAVDPDGQQSIGYRVAEVDHVDNKAALCFIKLL